MFIQALSIAFIIILTYFIAESLERYIFRYTLFPFIAVVLIFSLGMILGRGIERTRHSKPIGYLSKKMAAKRKRKNAFIFNDNGQTYVPHKEIIEDIKSGEIVHIKQFNSNDFDDMYNFHIDNLVDKEMDNKEDNEDEENSQ
jgi:hypothetical protein